MFLDNEIRAERYAIYIRKSEDDQQKQVRSVKDQMEECLDLAKKMGVSIRKEDIIIDERSAKRSGNRPKFTKLIKDIRKGEIDGLISWHPDRLARNMKEAGELIDLLDEELLVDLKFVSKYYVNDYNGKMALGIDFVLAKQYSDKLSVDVRRGIKKSLKEGKSGGQYKPGYIRDDITGYYEPDENICQNGMTIFSIVKEAWKMRQEGETLENITSFLNDNGYKRRIKRNRGKTQIMSKSKLTKMFNDTFYYGLFKQGGREIVLQDVCDFTPMIIEDEFLIVQRYRRKDLQVPKKHRYPFKGIIRCSECSKPLTAGAPKGRGGDKYLRYWCANKCFGSKGIRAKIILDKIVEVIENFEVEIERHYDMYLKEATEALKKEKKNIQIKKSVLLKKQKLAEGEYEDLVVAIKTKDNDKKDQEILTERKLKRKAELDSIEESLREVEKKLSKNKPMDIETFLNTLKSLSESLLSAHSDIKDEFVKEIFLNIIIKEGKIASVSLKEPFDSMVKNRKVLNGGPGWN